MCITNSKIYQRARPGKRKSAPGAPDPNLPTFEGTQVDADENESEIAGGSHEPNMGVFRDSKRKRKLKRLTIFSHAWRTLEKLSHTM